MNFFNGRNQKGKKSTALVLFCIFCIGFILLFAQVACPAPVGQATGKKDETYIKEGLTGSDIMDQVFKRQRLFPYVYEEQTLILTDNRGNKDVKKMRRFSRVETDGTLKYLLVFDNPEEVRGVALGITRDPKGIVQSRIYLPALGEPVSDLKKTNGRDFMGTDFSIEELVETVSGFIYTRKPDHPVSKQKPGDCFVVEASPVVESQGVASQGVASPAAKSNPAAYSIRRHYIRQDNFFIVRTDFFDHDHRLLKRLTHHDLKRIDTDMWQSNMLLMENIRDQHTTLIKIDRRILSRDYVTPEVFIASWFQEKYSKENRKTDAENASASSTASPATNPADRTHNRIGN
jgi:Outer membrane lipoprotein-sorting protein